MRSNSSRSRERAVLVGVGRSAASPSDNGIPVEDSLVELELLASSAGAEVITRFVQHLERPHPATFIGKGKVEEVRNFVRAHGPDVVIFDEELSPAQQRNLEAAFQVRVVDRSQLILDIFAQRARSNEGKLQVELAQLEYLRPRLTRRWLHLSRLGGGVGTRGPGETQLEVDRRRIRERIETLKQHLGKVERTRALQRQQRLEVPYSTIALVGYTNSGKSTLMNTLTHARVAAQDRLFETLDPTIRRLQLPNGDQAMVIDTVGFIHKIPHSLIEAFKSTLEEVRQADLLLHVIDLASPRCVEQIEVVDQVLRDIGAGEIPRIRVLNKIDLAPPRPLPGAENGSSGPCAISALSGEGVEELLRRLAAILDQGKERMQISLTPAQASLLSLIRRRGRVVEERYEDGRIHVTAMLTPKLAGQLRKWLARAEDGPSPRPC